MIIQSDSLTLALSVHDDSFYYLLPAWQFSTYGYFTFDGLHKTYGFQPLYMLLLTGLSIVLPSIETVFRVGLCVNATLHAATGVMVGLAVDAALPAVAGALRQLASLLAGGIYLLGLNLYTNNVLLKETPLAAFLYVLVILCLLRALSRLPGRSVLTDLAIGTLLGCLILARLLPASLLAVGVMLVVAGVCLSRRSTVVISVAMLVPLVIWAIYAKISFGHILPTSFLVKSEGGLLAAAQYWRALAPVDAYRLLAGYTSRIFLFLSDHGSGLGLARQVFLVVGVAALCGCAVFPAWWSRARTLVVALAAASLVGFFAIPVLLFSRQPEWFYTKWYLFDISAILTIVCGVALGFLGQMTLTRLAAHGVGSYPAAAVICVGLLWLGVVAEEARVYRNVRPLVAWEYNPERWNHVVARTSLWFRSEIRLEDGERVGAYNAGIVGFLLRGVVNLDGLANDDIVFHTARGGTLAEYVSRKRIRYVIDVVSPDRWKRLGLKVQVIRTEEFRHPHYPLYYVMRLP
jgi:hypothetical protein